MTEKMKLCVLGPVYPYRGGIALNTGLFAEALVHAGHTVKVISFHRQYPKLLYPGKSDRDSTLVFNGAPVDFVLDPINPFSWLKTVKIIKAFEPDLIFIPWWTTFHGPVFWFIIENLQRAGLKCVLCVHNFLPHESRFFDQWMTARIFHQIKAFMTFSPKESTRLRQFMSEANIFETRLPTPTIPAPAISQTSARERLGLPQNAQVVMMFGIVRPYKGLAVLLEALSLLKKSGKSIHLLVGGEFWEPEKNYRDKIDLLGLQDTVHIENRYIPDCELSSFFSAADAFVAPYVGGSQSGVLRLAIAFGLPLLLSDSIASDLDDDVSPIAHIHRAGDSQDLALSIKNFFDQPLPDRMQVIGKGWPGLADIITRIASSL